MFEPGVTAGCEGRCQVRQFNLDDDLSEREGHGGRRLTPGVIGRNVVSAAWNRSPTTYAQG